MMDATARPEIDRPEELVETRLVSWFFLAALGYLFVSMLGGMIMALQLVHWNPLQGVELLSPGRWRMIHTNAVAYGFIANGLLGACHWVVPRLTLKPVFSKPLSYLIFAAWQLVCCPRLPGFCWARPKVWSGGKRRFGSTPWPSWGCCWWPSTFSHPSLRAKDRCTSRSGTSRRLLYGPS